MEIPCGSPARVYQKGLLRSRSSIADTRERLYFTPHATRHAPLLDLQSPDCARDCQYSDTDTGDTARPGGPKVTHGRNFFFRRQIRSALDTRVVVVMIRIKTATTSLYQDSPCSLAKCPGFNRIPQHRPNRRQRRSAPRRGVVVIPCTGPVHLQHCG